MSEYESLLLPPQTRLFYIGPPKTGTTTLQESARVARPALYDNGVYYPGTGRNHMKEVEGLMRRRHGGDRSLARRANRAKRGKAPSLANWEKLIADINAEPTRRILISHEFAAEATDETAERFFRELGQDRTHIAITLRPLSAILPSQWNQSLKNGLSDTLDEWLQRLYGQSDQKLPDRVRRHLDQGGLVRRWANVVGPENVTVIIVGSSDKALLTSTFEQMLGLPEHTLTGAGGDSGRATNRSMTLPETEVFRQVNELLKQSLDVSWPLYYEVIKQGAIEHLLDRRTPNRDEPRPKLPQWAADRAMQEGKGFADQIAESGVRVVGDLASLHAEPSAAQGTLGVEADSYRDLAVEAVAGSYAGALKFETEAVDRILSSQDSGKDVAKPVKRSVHQQLQDLPRDARVQRAAHSFTTRDLARALRVRLSHKMRTGKTMRLH